MHLPQHLPDVVCTGLGNILIRTSVPSLSEASCSWKLVSLLVTFWLDLGSSLQGMWSDGDGAAAWAGGQAAWSLQDDLA